MFLRHLIARSLVLLVGLFLGPITVTAQTSISTGSISGLVSDPNGAAVSGAQVTITDKGTGQTIHVVTTSVGVYSSGALNPGDYEIHVAVPGFSTAEIALTVQVGVTTAGNAVLQVGQVSTVVKVTAEAAELNLQQATVQGVLTAGQIDSLPIDGRNFLSLAQLEPGVQIQDGSNFDPTKVGFSSISFGGRFGRSARIEVNGVDVSDETVGTTTEDIPASAIQEFQTQQSSLDLSTELTSSGGVNVITKSGTSKLHGEAFGLFRDSSVSAKLPAPQAFPTTFQRQNYGGDFGGPIPYVPELLHGKMFYFLDAEYLRQALVSGVPVAAPFEQFSGGAPLPFRETTTTDRIDYAGPHGLRMFYNFSYFRNTVNSAYGQVSYQIFANKDQTRQHIGGADFNTGNFTHSIRFSYLKFANTLVDAVRGSDLPLANFPATISIGTLFTGVNRLAPQTTIQSNHQAKYDGTWIHRNHIVRYGLDYNYIQRALDTPAYSTPNISTSLTSVSEAAAAANCPSGPFDPSSGEVSNPLCYPINQALIGNGQGYIAEQKHFGLASGGFPPNNRLGVYLGDTWVVGRGLTLTLGARYNHETNVVDSDLPGLPAVSAVQPGYRGAIGNPVQNDNLEVGPVAGVVWDPARHGKTVIRAGAGVYYSNVLAAGNDRRYRLPEGQILQFPAVCSSGSASPIVFGPAGSLANQAVTIDQFFGNRGPSICRESISQAAANLVSFQQAFQASSSAPGANPLYFPSQVARGVALRTGFLDPNFKAQRSYEMNLGFQHQFRPGVVLSVDYLRNIDTHILLGTDANHAGDVRFFNQTAALAAISATNSRFGCGSGTNAASTNCAIAAGATIASYASAGLDSPSDLGVGQCDISRGFSCAFPGQNPAAGAFPLEQPIGRAVYNALDVKLESRWSHPFPGFRSISLQPSYSLSRFTDQSSVGGSSAVAGDTDHAGSAIDNRNPLAFSGPSALDRTHQISFGALFEVPFGLRLSTIGHFDSPLASSLIVPTAGLSGEIFRSDFTGSGATGNLLPGTHVGNFDRGINAAQLNSVLASYNSATANNPTPAGQLLIQNGLFTASQLKALGGGAPALPLAPAGNPDLSWLRTMDLKLGWYRRITERFTVEPSVSFYNLFNFANFDPTISPLSGTLSGSACTLNGTVRHNAAARYNCPADRIGLGTGTFGLGAPRQTEFDLHLTF